MTLQDMVESPEWRTAPEHLQRVILEWWELRTKVLKLQSFINGPAFGNVNPKERDLLSRQFTAMAGYKLVLEDRMTFATINWRKFIV